ncbi:hypothetical protein ACHHYP_15707 [Achlya hypogyna]|uniref:M96 mating-specific protein family n=1 Tax=Achlya hypogyna TaxID=1202772 RepID=A0A1V9YA67_ACHHY|nr:hypothetical protein ACHHYP_15707 [Achlya hypogyna]
MGDLQDDLVADFNKWLSSVDLNAPPGDEPKTRPLSAFQRYQLKQKNELQYLQATVAELHERARVLKASADAVAATKPPSKWEKLAKRELKRRFKAEREHGRLQECLQEQVKFAESLVAIIRKRPRFSLFSADAPGRPAALGITDIERRAACHSLADAEYIGLESAFIEARLVDSATERRQYVARLDHGTIEVLTTLQWHFRSVGRASASRAVWDVLRGAYPVRSVGGKYELLEELDDDTALVHSVCQYSVGTMLRRVVMRRYAEAGRVVIVGRHITADARHPLDPTLDVAQEVSWLTLEEVDGFDADVGAMTRQVVVKYFQKSKPSFSRFRPTEIREPESKYLMELYGSYCDGFIRTMEMLVEAESSGGSSSDDTSNW